MIGRKGIITVVMITAICIGVVLILNIPNKDIANREFIDKIYNERYRFEDDKVVENYSGFDSNRGTYMQNGKKIEVEIQHSEYSDPIKEELFFDGEYLAEYQADNVSIKRRNGYLEGEAIFKDSEKSKSNVIYKFFTDGTGVRDRNHEGSVNSISFEYKVNGNLIQVNTDEPELGSNGKLLLYYHNQYVFEKVFTEI